MKRICKRWGMCLYWVDFRYSTNYLFREIIHTSVRKNGRNFTTTANKVYSGVRKHSSWVKWWTCNWLWLGTFTCGYWEEKVLDWRKCERTQRGGDCGESDLRAALQWWQEMYATKFVSAVALEENSVIFQLK